MKKILIVLLALIMVFSFVACGEEAAPAEDAAVEQQESGEDEELYGYGGDDGAALGDVNEDNYVEICADLFGLDVAPPDGWDFVSVESPNGVNNLILKMNSSTETDGKGLMKSYFDQTLAVTEDGVYSQEVNWDTLAVSRGEAYADFDSYFNSNGTYFEGDCTAIWLYSYGGKSISLSYSFTGGEADLSLTLAN